MLKHELTEQAGVVVLRVQEENLDALTVPEARLLVEQLVERGGIKVVFEMSAVKVIDSSGVAIIVSLFKRLRALGGAVRVAGVAGQPKDIFAMLRLDQALPIFPTAEEALKGF
ncbi:MAG: STAS domain-containing protein [Deltaproteobacteria bacterium]|jgi:anti-sigma B factor antagonist|nr:STAS domain-containing protein [Myxococcales bacterium]MDP3219840.1 STAS domain-containing protein [Deltaproteobacteria bacterium]